MLPASVALHNWIALCCIMWIALPQLDCIVCYLLPASLPGAQPGCPTCSSYVLVRDGKIHFHALCVSNITFCVNFALCFKFLICVIEFWPRQDGNTLSCSEFLCSIQHNLSLFLLLTNSTAVAIPLTHTLNHNSLVQCNLFS